MSIELSAKGGRERAAGRKKSVGGFLFVGTTDLLGCCQLSLATVKNA
jgi:hypothetical protein